MTCDKDVVKAIRRAAMNALARREHTRKELEQKLAPKFPGNRPLLLAVFEQLAAEGLQSDRRFAESYVRWRSGRGYGPLRISMELAQKGIGDELADEMLLQPGIDWQQSLHEQFIRKYGDSILIPVEEKARAMRFFQYRGFTHEQLRLLFRPG